MLRIRFHSSHHTEQATADICYKKMLEKTLSSYLFLILVITDVSEHLLSFISCEKCLRTCGIPLVVLWCILYVLIKFNKKQTIKGQGFSLLHLRRLTTSCKPWQNSHVKAEGRRETLLQLVGKESSAFLLLLPSLLMYFIYFSQMYSTLPALGTGTKRKSPTLELNATAVRLEISCAYCGQHHAFLWPSFSRKGQRLLFSPFLPSLKVRVPD